MYFPFSNLPLRLNLVSRTIIFLILFVVNCTYISAQQPDIILYNGKIFTGDTNKLYVNALAVRGNLILKTGTNKEIEKLATTKTKRIDLHGRTVIPGFNDAHDHLGWLIRVGQSFITDFSIPGPSRKAVVDSLSRLIKQARPGQWIQGTIGLTVFNDTSVRRRLLDSLSLDHPIALQIMWGHGIILNSKAMRLVAISDTAQDPLSGWYERFPGTNVLSGLLYEGSEFPVWQAITTSEPDKTIQALREHANEELALGITTVQNMSATLQGNAARNIFAKANLPLRVRIIAMPATTTLGRSLGEWKKDKVHVTPLTYISGIKYVIDGTTLEQTALKKTVYPNRPGWYGRLNYPTDTIRQILHEALITDRQLMMHLVGDSATNIVLKLMKSMATDKQWQKKRVRIEHGNSILSAENIKMVSDMGIVIVHTPQYGMVSPLQTWRRSRISMAMGPDAVINPYLGIFTVTTKQIDPNQNLTREQAVMAYTQGSAFAEFAEQKKGRLTKGMLADLAVLSQDLFSVPTDQLLSTHSVLTMVDGKIVYRQEADKPNAGK